MGMRHQIYIKLPAHLPIGHPQHSAERFVGLHLQNLWGYRAVGCLYQFLTFWKNHYDRDQSTLNYTIGWHALDIAKAVWAVDIQNGWFSQVDVLDWPTDPIKGDTCDGTGITIVDLYNVETGRIRYAFMLIRPDFDKQVFTSLTAGEYLKIKGAKTDVELGDKFEEFELIPTDQVFKWFPRIPKLKADVEKHGLRWLNVNY